MARLLPKIAWSGVSGLVTSTERLKMGPKNELRPDRVDASSVFVVIDGKNSLLPLLTFDAADGWGELGGLAQPEIDSGGVARLMEAVGGTTRTVAVERHYIDKDYRDTFSNFHSKRFNTPGSRCLRLHFFSRAVTREEIKQAASIQADYLGYAIIRPTRPNCLGRTLLKPEARATVSGSMRLCQEKITLQGTELTVCGFPFISQDADVTVCAQSALWMLARYFSNRYPLYPETYPYQLAKLTEDYSLGRWYPSSGLYVWQMTEALRRLGFSPVTYSRSHFPNDFDHYLYTYIESGIPVLAATKRHAIVAFGHKSDYIPPSTPPGEISFSSQFNHALVGNDDNRVPYQFLRDRKNGNGQESQFEFRDIEAFVAPLAEKIFLPAESFQRVVTTILGRGDVGFKALSATLSAAPLVLRLFLTTARSFKKRLAERSMGNPIVESMYRNLPLPHFFWVCEISQMEDYLKQMVHGEILWDATRNASEPDGWIALHHPEVFVVDVGSALNRSQELQKYALQNSQTYPLYRSNLQDIRP